MYIIPVIPVLWYFEVYGKKLQLHFICHMGNHKIIPQLIFKFEKHLQRYILGLRKSMILTGGMMLLGTALRCLPGISIGSFTW